MRPVVAAQDDGPGAAVALAEVEDVVDRGAAERVDRLIVVPDDGHAPVALGKEADELRLGAVRVLEFVDEDVPEPGLDCRTGRRGLANEP